MQNEIVNFFLFAKDAINHMADFYAQQQSGIKVGAMLCVTGASCYLTFIAGKKAADSAASPIEEVVYSSVFLCANHLIMTTFADRVNRYLQRLGYNNIADMLTSARYGNYVAELPLFYRGINTLFGNYIFPALDNFAPDSNSADHEDDTKKVVLHGR